MLVPLALMTTMAGLLGLQWQFVSGGFTRTTSEARFLRGPCDDTGHITYRIGALKQDPPKGNVVWMVGGSTMRECIETPGSLQRAIAARSGGPSKVIVLGSCEQHFSQTLAIIDNLPPGKGVVVIGVHHTPFSAGKASVRRQLKGLDLPLLSAALHNVALSWNPKAPPATIIPGILDYVRIYDQKRGAPAFTGAPLTYNIHRYDQGVEWTHHEKFARVGLWVHGRGRAGGPFFHNFAMNARILEECVKLARARGFQVLLVESSQNDDIIGHAWDRYRSMYRALCARLAAKYGAHFVNPNTSAGLVDGDFHDLLHLVPSGRAKWTPVLAAALAPLVKAATP